MDSSKGNTFSAKVMWGAPKWEVLVTARFGVTLLLLQRGPPQQPNLEFTGTFLFSQLPQMLAPAKNLRTTGP